MSLGHEKIKFLKPASDNVSYFDKSEPAIESNVTNFIYNKYRSQSLQTQRQRLPIFNYRNHILYLLEKHQCLVLVGETGCGKSTQIPQYLVEAEWTKDGTQVAVAQPRRVAAITLAKRVAEETETILGHNIGYSVRFDECSSKATKIKYMTDGILIREMMADPLLNKYCVVILDEVHERNLNTDILMGLLKKVLRKRKSLRLIVASATLDAENMRDFFNTNTTKDKGKDSAVIMSVQGRAFPVDKFYLKEPIPDYVIGTVDTIIAIHEKEAQGDILAFLTGQEEVDRAITLINNQVREDAIKKNKSKQNLVAFPMYGSLPHNDQLQVFRSAPDNSRKVIIATNIAETSVTIPGIVYVVDCGFVKLRWYSTDTQTDRLVVVPVSKASAEQRAGRAGRVRPGKAYRLYTESAYEDLPLAVPPEMQRTSLLTVVLQLKALGIDNLLRFNFPSPPSARNLSHALELLFALDAIDSKGELTKPIGITMAEFALDPLHSKMLLSAAEMGCSREILTIVSMVQVENVFAKPSSGHNSVLARIRKRHFEVEEGDLITLLNVYTGYENSKNPNSYCHKNFFNIRALKRVSEIRSQIEKMMRSYGIPIVSAKGDTELICKCITTALFPNAAYLHYSGVYKTVRGDIELYIHPNSVFYTIEQPQWLLFTDILFTTKLYMRELTKIKQEWLLELAPHFYRKTTLKDYA